MRSIFCALTSLLLLSDLYGQEPLAQQKDFNLALLSHREIQFPLETSDQYIRYADIWGYAAADGSEYAILGTGIGTAIYDLSDPADPTLAILVPGALSRWRDFKSFGNYIYGVADEGKDGLLIIDMSGAPNNITWSFWNPTLSIANDDPKTLERCHNLYIDSSFVFLAGCNIHGGGVVIFDLAATPLEPVLVSAADRKYAHDVYARKDRMYTSDLNQGFAIVDIADIRNPKTLVTQETSRNFTHNSWASTDGHYLFTTDERSSATIDAYDIRDLDDIKLLDQYRPTATLRNPVIPHNVHYYNGYLVISYYTDGVKIVDAHEPDNLVEVGSFDTYQFRDDGFHGAWGAFPFLPSGLVLVSDIESGLYVFEPRYQRAAYLQGTVSDQNAGSPISGVQISVDSDKPGKTQTSADGTYKMGWAGEGLVTLKYFKNGYAPKTIEIQLIEGQYTSLDVQLEPLNKFIIAGSVMDSISGALLPNAQVLVFNDIYEQRTTADLNGDFTLEVFAGDYAIGAGIWSYEHGFIISTINQDQANLVLKLKPGYRDDFAFDFGWSVSNSAGASANQGWQKGNPMYAIYNAEFANPNGDLNTDFGKECFVTGLAGNLGGNLSDTSILVSPLFDVQNYNDPFINYYLWFYDFGVLSPDDDLQIYLGNGTEEVLIENVQESASGWRPRSEIRISDHLPPTNNMYLKLMAADKGNVHIYEAGIDAFSITEGQTTSITDGLPKDILLSVFPNPFYSNLSFEGTFDEIKLVTIYDLNGMKISAHQIDDRQKTIDLSFLPEGFYLAKFSNEKMQVANKKIIKLR